MFVTFRKKKVDPVELSGVLKYNYHPLAMMRDIPYSVFSMVNAEALVRRIDWRRIYESNVIGNVMYKMLCPSMTFLPTEYHFEKDAFPRFWFSRSYKVIGDKDEILDALMKPGFNPNDEVILDKKPDDAFEGIYLSRKPEAITVARITHFEPDEIRVSLSGQGGWLTLSDTYFPGWSASVDGKRRPVYKGNYIFRTIPIFPGENELVLKYEAPALKMGLLVSMVSALIILCLLLVSRPRVKKNRI